MPINSNAKIYFILNGGKPIKDKKKPVSIFIRVKESANIDVRTPIGFKILLADWNLKTQKVRDKIHIENRSTINTHLIELSLFVNQKIIALKTRNIPLTNILIKQIVKEFTKPQVEIEKHNLFSFIDKFIQEAKNKANVHTGRLVAKQTITSYQVTKNFLQRFNDEVYKINFDTITLDFYFDFLEWSQSQNLTKNYIGKHIKVLKTFLNESLTQELHNNHQFKSKKFKVLKEPADNIYLTNDELLKLWNLDLKDNVKQDNTRDLFLIGAFTGLRVSDYNNLSSKHIKKISGVDMLYIKTQKTGKIVAIPLHPVVKSILEKYKWNTPPKIAPQTMNYVLPDLCLKAEINTIEHKTQTIGKQQITFKKYRYEMVKTHTARRSFCTNAYG